MKTRTQMGAAALAACVALALMVAPAESQTLGGLGQPGQHSDQDAPRQAPSEPAKAPEPARVPEPEQAPPPAPEPPPVPEPPPAPATVPQPEPPPAPEPPHPGPSDNAPVRQAPPSHPSDNAPIVGSTPPGRSERVTTPIGQRPEAHPSPRHDGGDYLYPPPPTVIVVPPPVIVVAPPPAPLPPVPVPSPNKPGKLAWPKGSPQAAFADIERAWTQSDLTLLRRHVRDGDTKIGVSQGGKFVYSLTTRDFLSLTRTAFGRLDTISFRFTRLRREKNGDMTAYGTHIYRVAQAAPKTAVKKKVYVTYTLRRLKDRWDIVNVGSSPKPLP